MLAPALVRADPTAISEGVFWGNNFPGVKQGAPLPFALDNTGALKVTGTSGGGGITTIDGQYNPQPFPTAPVGVPTALPLLVDSSGALYVQPKPGTNAFNTGVYAFPYPIALPGASIPISLDQNGLQVMSPNSNILSSTGQFNLTPPTYADGQVAPLSVDQQGHLLISAATPLPVTNEQTISVLSDKSGTVGIANQSQVVFFPNANRHGLLFQNQSTGNECLQLYGGLASCTAGGNSILVYPNTPPFFTPSNMATQAQISVTGGTIGQQFHAEEW